MNKYTFTREEAENWVAHAWSGTISGGSENISIRYCDNHNSADIPVTLNDNCELVIQMQRMALALLQSVIEGRDSFDEVNAQRNLAEIFLHNYADLHLDRWLPENFYREHGYDVHVNFYLTFCWPVSKFLREHE